MKSQNHKINNKGFIHTPIFFSNKFETWFSFMSSKNISKSVFPSSLFKTKKKLVLGFTHTLNFVSNKFRMLFFGVLSKKLQRVFCTKNNVITKRKLVCGFTLVEMIVSVAIFSVVMLIGVGSLLSMMAANKKSQSIQLVMNNLNFAIEDITRTIRIGTAYHCGSGDIMGPKDCVEGNSFLAFEPAGGDIDTTDDQVIYRLNNNQIEKSTKGGATNSFIAITAPEVKIEKLMFYVQGSEGGSDKRQPRVLIILSGYSGEDEKTKSNFNIQTTISQRILDF